MKARWQQEKQAIEGMRELKKQIEEARFEAEKATQAGDLGKAAELRYGTLPTLEQELQEGEAKLDDMHHGQKRMLKEEVDAEDVAEVVAKWTGIPVTRMLESEVDRSCSTSRTGCASAWSARTRR